MTYHIDDIPAVVDRDESDIQEFVCWFLCCFWGEKHNIATLFSDDQFTKGERAPDSWPGYLAWKIDHILNLNQRFENVPPVEWFWQALIRFRQMVDQNEL